MNSFRPVRCPSELHDLLVSFVAEESTSSIRHDVRGKLASVRNGVFYIRRKLEAREDVLKSDPRLAQFLGMIDDEIALLGEMVVSRLRPPSEVAPADAEPLEVLGQLAQWIELPPGLSISLPEGPGPGPRVRCNPGELGLALFCLLENAIEAAVASPQKTVEVKLKEEEAKVALSVSDQGPGFGADLEAPLRPFFSTKLNRMGVGLKIARRISTRWGGQLALKNSGQGATVTMLFKPS